MHHQVLQARPLAGRSSVIQPFPYSVRHKTEPLSLVARLEGRQIRLYQNGIDRGYLEFTARWDLKDILVDQSLRGKDLASVLVYFYAALAAANGAHNVDVLTPSGTGLWRRTGFVITPNAINSHNPPSVSGVTSTVRNTARQLALNTFTIEDYVAPQPAPRPAPHMNPRRNEDAHSGKGGIFEL
ncbi:MAG: hypothetical protein M3O15_00250 [Acidobacteriota bacterium]|nr:hypothetical protein [Acidobacteriota bacterium]